MKVRLTPRAFADQDKIFDYLSEHSSVGARNVLAAFQRTYQLLEIFPWAGEAANRAGMRALSLRSYPYRVFYRVEPDGIEIIHIRHTSRRPWTGT